MKIKPSTRTRLYGYFGIAVTTLLTPGGKLISSALAAATVVGLVTTMNTPTKDEKTSNSAATNIAYTGTQSTDSLLNVSALSITGTASDTLTPEALASDQYAAQDYVPQENQAAFTAQTLPAANLVTLNTINPNTANAPNGLGVPSSPPLGPKLGPKFTPELDVPALPDGVPPEIIKDQATPDDVLKPELGEVPSPINDPVVLGPLDPVKDSVPEDDATPSFPKIAALAPDITNPQIQPLLALAEISEPPTLAMLLLGLTGFGWLYRRKQPLSRGPAI